MVVRANKVFSAQYFTDEVKAARYFLSEGNLGSRWIAGDPRFGVYRGAEVADDHLSRLFAGQDELGRSLLMQTLVFKKRVSAFELSVSTPKSVSAAWALAQAHDRAKIEIAFAKALDGVSTYVCRNAKTRLGHNGRISVAVVPNIAAFIQPDTRPVRQADGVVAIQPQLHGHLVIPNIVAITSDEFHRHSDTSPADVPANPQPLKFLTRAIDGHAVFNGAKSWGAVANLVLATELQRLGYTIDQVGENGTFEIQAPIHEQDKDKLLRKFWSQRRAEIEADLDELGLTTAEAPAMAAAAAVRTRRAKLESVGDCFARWRKEAGALGIDVERYTVNRQAEAELTGLREAEIAVRMREIPRRLTDFEATFDDHDLVREVATVLVGTGAELERVDAEISKLIDAGEILQIGSTERVRIFSTPEMIKLEREVVQMAQKLAAGRFQRIDTDDLTQRCEVAGLSLEQSAALEAATRAGRVAFIEGRAGVGKTTTLLPLCRSLQQSDERGVAYGSDPIRVIAAGVSWRTARALQKELSGSTTSTQVEGRALASWLKVKEAGGRFMDANSVLLLDEVSQVGVRDMHALLQELQRAGGRSSVLFLGDRSQVLPVNASSGIECVARCIEAVEIAKVVRQTDPELRQMVESLAKGDVKSAVTFLDHRGDVHEAANRKSAISTVVDRYFELLSDRPEGKHFLICKSNTTRLAIDAEVRRRMRLDGTLSGPDVKIDAITPSGRSYRLSLAAGDRIRFGIRCKIDNREFINGTTALVREVVAEDDGHALISAVVEGRDYLFSSRDVVDQEGRVRLATDYCLTSWSSQGLTSDTSVVLAEPSWDARDVYVALSRARTRSIMVVNAQELDFAVRGQTGFDRDADEVTKSERLAYLTAQMSRWRVKSSTLQWVAEAVVPFLHDRTSERRHEAEM